MLVFSLSVVLIILPPFESIQVAPYIPCVYDNVSMLLCIHGHLLMLNSNIVVIGVVSQCGQKEGLTLREVYTSQGRTENFLKFILLHV